MEHSNVHATAGHDEHPLHTEGAPVQTQEQAAARVSRRQGDNIKAIFKRRASRKEAQVIAKEVEVIVVCSTWWPTRAKQGVHVLHPTQAGLMNAMRLAYLLGTNTVYAYHKLPH